MYLLQVKSKLCQHHQKHACHTSSEPQEPLKSKGKNEQRTLSNRRS